ncbi:hypothetical protein KSI01_28440 [Kurthia sibirica]|uniref:DUF1033 domain-containing protein n=2 Tax=Kurthia sibirica TaxID=202750 RepID=A0A2U3AHZ5_9BACL|nr:DUF1033 family protein [Kurthia sibirica]PWI24140.1 DUF1033 domain-containing protein [Kurthia sibirica]GEK35311.1 hypothetical protein KSI01_28440 [Kurthia sibirica]
MYKVIYMKADYEPWWQFEGWQDYVVSESIFTDEREAQGYLAKKIQEFSTEFCYNRKNKERFWAFWSEGDEDFCEQCADSVQIYHGLIWQEEQ